VSFHLSEVREQNTVVTLEKYKKTLETQVTELTVKVDEAESYALKGGRKALAGLQDRVKEIEDELDAEQRRHGETLKNFRKMERHLKETQFQADEDHKNQQRLQELVAKLQAKLKHYKKANEDAEQQANANLAKFRKAAHELEDAEERADMAEQALTKIRTKSRTSESAGSSSYTNVRKTTTTKSLQ
jgi:chromosome segregation ATPase